MAWGREDGGGHREPSTRPSETQPRTRSVARSVALWGVLNVTPDSFSDGGLFLSPEAAVARAKEMIAQGVDVIDVGGASSRPAGRTYGEGAKPVATSDEIARVAPVVRVLAAELGAIVSIDTTRGEVARAALSAGARIVNDVSMGASDALLDAVAEASSELVLMHTRGDGSLSSENTRYDDVVREVSSELGEAVERAVARGVAREKVWIDPGIGFAKTATQSAVLLGRLSELAAIGPRVLVGASRKSFIAALAPRPDGSAPPAAERIGGSLAALTLAVAGGAAAVRVHDVAESYQALRVARAATGALDD